MMKRLMNLNLYQRDHRGVFDEELIIQLVRNYRSPKVLLTVPNQLFYDGTLEAMSKKTWEILKKRSDAVQHFGGNSLIFHSVLGRHYKRDKSVVSLQNRDEAK